MSGWVPDELLPGYQRLVLELPLAVSAPGEPEDAPLTGSLIRRNPPRHDRAVMYLHGWSDYFFQTHLADHFDALGFDFYAVELRRYGRNLAEGQLGGYITDLDDYTQELDAALAVVRPGHPRVAVMGHSTGGLIAALWVDKRPGEIDGLLLNSPWLDLQGSGLMRALGGSVSALAGSRYATTGIPLPGSTYARSIHNSLDGEWDFDLGLKQHPSFQVRPAWLNAVMRGHDRVAAGLSIDTPVLSLISARSWFAREWNDEAKIADSVLDVGKLAKRSVMLGPDVSVVRITDGLHDLALSAETPRAAYFEAIDRWVGGYLDWQPAAR